MCIRKGFTLIELLVVIVIIVILFVMLMQVGGKLEPSPNTDPNLPPTSTQVIDKIVKELEWGNIVFNAPNINAVQRKRNHRVAFVSFSINPGDPDTIGKGP